MLLCSHLLFVVAVTLPASAIEIRVSAEALRLSSGQAKSLSFRTVGNQSTFLFVEARVDGGQGFGCHAVALRLDGRPLAPEAAVVLNKTEVVQRRGDSFVRHGLYDTDRGAWFLVCSEDYPSDRAQLCHYYDYLFELKDVAEGEHHLTAKCSPPESQKAANIHVRSIVVWQQTERFLASTHDWDEDLHSWQAPQPDMLITRPLEITGCAGEFEPVTFNIFALRELRDVNVECGDLVLAGDKPAIPTGNLKTFWLNKWRPPPDKDDEDLTPFTGPEAAEAITGAAAVQEPEVSIAQEIAAEETRPPGLPEPEAKEEEEVKPATPGKEERGVVCGSRNPVEHKTHPPEQLIPLAEMKPTVPALYNVRFYLDLRIPDEQPPGIYGGKVRVSSPQTLLAEIPIQCRVLPVKLDPPRQTYWMWRLTWSPVWKPENVACLRDIREHGYTGLVRACGARFRVRVTEAGEVKVDASSYAKLVEVLKETGLALRIGDTGVANVVVGAALKHVGLRLSSDQATHMDELTNLRKCFEKKYLHKALADEAKGRFERMTKEMLTAGDEEEAEGEEPIAEELGERPPEDKRKKIIERAHKEADRVDRQVRALVVEGFRKIKDACQTLGIKMDVFPVDEPCGTKWRRQWTTYAAGLAKEAGLETWSTLNNFRWESNIDHGACGGRIVGMYREPELVTASYKGNLKFSPLPMIAAFRGGAKYHFRGALDEVRIYNRPLSNEEMTSQHERPVAEHLIAHYAFESESDRLVVDHSGNGHDARIVGKPARVPGRVGQAMLFNGVDEHLDPRPPKAPLDLSRGWSLSLWYRGGGCLFGRGYEFYYQPGLRYTTTEEERKWFSFGAAQHHRCWAHVTISFDNQTKLVKAYVNDREVRKWYRENVRWCYMQVRLRWPNAQRFQTGIQSWYYGNHGALRGITTFGYDWNNRTCVVVPKDGERFNPEGVWYRTIGWEACREGIDDARYMQTLVNVLQAKRGLAEQAAIRKVSGIIAPVTGQWSGMKAVDETFGTYGALRQRIIQEILKHSR